MEKTRYDLKAIDKFMVIFPQSGMPQVIAKTSGKWFEFWEEIEGETDHRLIGYATAVEAVLQHYESIGCMILPFLKKETKKPHPAISYLAEKYGSGVMDMKDSLEYKGELISELDLYKEETEREMTDAFVRKHVWKQAIPTVPTDRHDFDTILILDDAFEPTDEQAHKIFKEGGILKYAVACYVQRKEDNLWERHGVHGGVIGGIVSTWHFLKSDINRHLKNRFYSDSERYNSVILGCHAPSGQKIVHKWIKTT